MSRIVAITIFSLLFASSSRRRDDVAVAVDAFVRDVVVVGRASSSAPSSTSSGLPSRGGYAIVPSSSSSSHVMSASPPSSSSSSSSLSLSSSTTTTTTLTEETTWRLRILLRDVTTTNGRKLDGGKLFVVEGKFVEDEGYEPPQGRFVPIVVARDDGEEVEVDGSSTVVVAAATGGGGGAGTTTTTTTTTTTLEVAESRWKLSEDPDDPKDGLWIWGLFKEPLYPYMLLQLETREVKLPSSTDGVNDDSIPALKLYARISHIRNNGGDDKKQSKGGGGGVELKTADLNVRVLERINLPGASVDVYEEEAVGQISFQPLS